MSDNSTFQINAPQQRALQILFLLAGREAEGLPQASIAKAIQTSGSRVHHDLRNLQHGGAIERLANGNWRLSPRVVQIAIAHEAGLARLSSQLDELRNRYSRSAA